MGLSEEDEKFIESIRARYRTTTPDPQLVSRAQHMGLKIGEGLHGSVKLNDSGEETLQFIDQLLEAGNQTGYLLQRLHLAPNPLRLVIIGRNYSKKEDGSKELTDKLVTRDDLVLIDDKYRKFELDHFAQVAKEARIDGSTSTLMTPPGDHEIYGPPPGSDRSSECVYTVKNLLNHLARPDFKRVYQHGNLSDTVLGCGRIVTSNGVTGVVYSKSLVSEVEGQGVSYAVLMPRNSPFGERQQAGYEATLKEEARRSFLRIKSQIR